MRLDFSKAAFIEAAVHLTIAALAATLHGMTSPEIQADGPVNAVQTLA